MTTAFELVTVGKYQLANRITMAPMSRSRAYGPVRAQDRPPRGTTSSGRPPV
jgi:2,4-dienoyl-CoA reductase-like NADH-dependent reductase (Old Yellow Enzyme family)